MSVSGGLAVNPQIQMALVYYLADLNLRVFPLHDVESGVCSCPKGVRCGKDSGKHPRVTAWQKEATNDFEKVINRWWKKWPNANIGIPTGRLNDMFVIDIDKPAVWDRLILEHGNTPPTYEYITGGGGRHLWFNYPEDQLITNSKGGFPLGIDIRGDGGYILAPPSKTLKGAYRVEYS